MNLAKKPTLSGAVLLASALSIAQVFANSFDNGTTNILSVDTSFDGELYVGVNNPDNTLLIDSGSTVNADELIIGNSESSTNNLLSVENGSTLVIGTTSTNGITSGIVVGDADGADAIRINNNSALEGENLYMGVSTNDSADINLQGEGSSIEISNDAKIGMNGDDSSITIGSGAALNVGGDLVVGETGSNNLISVTGSLFVNETNNVVVASDTDNKIRINNGGTLQVGGDIETGTLDDLGVEMRTGATLELGGDLSLTKNRIDDRYHVILNNDLSASNTASWTTSLLTAIGKTSSDNSLTLTNGATGTAEILQIGQESAANRNMLNVGGAGSQLTATGDLTVGNSGDNNELNVSDGGQLDAQKNLYIGKNSSASGNEANIGSNGTLNVTSTIIVGDNGANSKLNITDGHVSSAEIILGNNSIGNRLSASGSNAQVTVSGDFTIGSEEGSASETIRNQTDTKGSMASFSDGAAMDVQNLTVGNDGSGSILTIRDEAVVNVSSNAVIGRNSGDNYIFLERGSNALFNVAGNLTVGMDGDAGDNRFAVYGGTANIDGDLLVGANTNQHELKNYIHLETTNATLNVANAIEIGSASSDNTMTLAEGATATTTDLLIGAYTGTSNNIVTVKGDDSLLTVSGSLEIGSINSGGNSLILQNGGTLDIAQENIMIGSTNDNLTVADGGILKTLGWDFADQTDLATNIVFESGSTLHMMGALEGTNMVEGGLSFILDGNSSSWDAGTNDLYVGYETDNNSLTITNGASATSSNDLYIGYASTDNTVTVGGSNSTLTVGDDLYVGYDSDDSWQNQLQVLDGALVSVDGNASLYAAKLKIDSSSQVNVGGDYEQDSTSLLEVGVSSNQVSPNLVVGGNAEFEEDSRIYVYDDGVSESNVINIVQAGSMTIDGETATTGQLLNNIQTNLLLDFNITVSNGVANTYIVVDDFIKRSLGEATGLTGQLRDVADELGAMAEDGDELAQDMLKTLGNKTADEATTSLDNLYGETASSIPAHNVINAGLQSVAEQLFMRADTTRTRNGSSSGTPVNKTSMPVGSTTASQPNGVAGPHASGQELQGWIAGFGTWAETKSKDDFDGYDTTMSGFMIGADMSVAENVLVGVAGGSGSSKIDKDNEADADTKSIYAALYSSIGTKDWFGDISLIYADSSVDANLDETFDTQAEYDTENIAFQIGGGKEFKTKYLIYTPEVFVLGNYYSQDEYTEDSSDAVGREVDSFSTFYMQTGLGGSMAMYLGMGNITLKPEVRAYWIHEWLGDEEELNYNLIGGTDSYNMLLQAPEEDIFKLGIGSSAKIGEYLELRADLDFRFSKDYSDTTLLGSLRYQF